MKKVILPTKSIKLSSFFPEGVKTLTFIPLGKYLILCSGIPIFVNSVFIGFVYGFVIETPRGNIQGVIGKARGLFDGFCKKDGYAKKLLDYDIE